MNGRDGGGGNGLVYESTGIIGKCCLIIFLILQVALSIPALMIFYSSSYGKPFFIFDVIVSICAFWFIIFRTVFSWIKTRSSFRLVGIICLVIYLASELALVIYACIITGQFITPLMAKNPTFEQLCMNGQIGYSGFYNEPSCEILHTWYIVGAVLTLLLALLAFVVSISSSSMMSQHMHADKLARIAKEKEAERGSPEKEPLLESEDDEDEDEVILPPIAIVVKEDIA